jgi:HK97 family phage prohead protease
MKGWETKTVPFEVKTIEEQDDRWEIKGYASVFNTPDRVKDIVMPGAFTKTINDNNGNFPLIHMHNKDIILGGAKLSQDEHGMPTDAFMLKEIQAAREDHALAQAGVLNGFSYSYKIIKGYPKKGFRHLTELRVGEVTIGPRSMIAHPDALITEVKFDFDQCKTITDFDEWMKKYIALADKLRDGKGDTKPSLPEEPTLLLQDITDQLKEMM